MTTYGQLRATGPGYKYQYWQELRALYQGGESLLCNDTVMARMLPPNPYEDAETYNLRRSKAVYIPYAGNIVNYLVSSLAAEPVTVTGTPDPDPFYAEFVESVDTKSLTLQGLLKETFCTAMQTGIAYALVDLPPRDDGAVIESAADEEEVGALRAMCFPVEPESVLDYEEDASGELEWAVVCMRSQPRESIDSNRDTVKETYTVYTRTDFTRYDVTYKLNEPPKPEDVVPVAEHGAHTFGRVPLIRLRLPHGLWAMDQVANVAKAHFNLRSSVAWSQSKALYPQLTAFLAPEIGKGGELQAEVAQNPTRATDQVYGIGRVVVYGKEDRLEYVGPNPAVYTAAYTDLESLRDEIYRVLNNMAMAANTSHAVARSGHSKEMDRAAAQIVLLALGVLGREFVKNVYDLVAAGRKDPPIQWAVHGMQMFDTSSVSDVIEDASMIDSLKIPSETFQRIRIFNAVKRVLTGIATPEQLDKIEEELEKNVSAEEFSGSTHVSTVEWGQPMNEQAPIEPRPSTGPETPPVKGPI